MKTSDKDNSIMHFEIKVNSDSEDKTFKDVNTIAKMIFDFLVQEKGLQDENITLCIEDGFIITADSHSSRLKEIEALPRELHTLFFDILS